jgi:ribonuclease Z
MIDFLLLGTGGMLPLPDRWLSSLLVRCGGDLILFDCGEGTQIPWRRFGWGFRRVAAICLSHCHADHVGGLPGLLLALANAGREEPVDLYGPAGTPRVVAGLRTIAPVLPYELRVTELAGGDRFPLPGGLTGAVLAGEHALPVLAYRADLARSRRFDPDRATARGVPLPLWRRLQHGEAVAWPGGAATSDDVLGPPRRGLAFAYATDTRPVAKLASFLRGIDLLVCEGTYGDQADLPKAIERGHMTFREAATLARDAGAGALWLTHFSPALERPDAYLPEATALFPETTIGRSGLTTTLSFDDELDAEDTPSP